MKNLLKSILISLLVITAIIFAGCETSSELPQAEMDRNAPDENSKGVELKKYNGNKLEYLLQARSITRYYEDQRTIADSVYIMTVEEDTGIVSTVICDTTIIDDRSNIIKGIGNVVFKYGDLRRIETNLALWDRTSDRITCPGEVDYWDENTYLNGYNLITNSKLEMTKMEKVSGQGVADEKTFGDFSNRSKRNDSSE